MRLLYFAAVRQTLGVGEETIALPAGIATLADLAAHLTERSPAHAAVFADTRFLRAAVNQSHANFTDTIGEGDEIAFFPPMTGG